MKKYLVAGFSLLAITVQAQKTSPSKTPAKAPVKAPAKPTTQPLKNKVDSVSYAIGFLVANFYKNQQGIKNLNSALVAKAISDIYGGKIPVLDENGSNLTLMRFLNPALDKTIAEGEAFLAANKKRAGVKTTASGLQYEVLTEGKGPRPSASDTIIAHYAGTLINGAKFDNSYDRGTPITIAADAVIRGWTEVLQLMPVGSKYKVYIPHQLGYGLNDQGPAIPGGSVLVFEMELLGIQGK